MYVFSLADICRAKTIPVEIKDDNGNLEGVVYLKEPSAIEGVKLQESLNAEIPWHKIVLDILALTLSDENGNALVNSPADRNKLESLPPRMLVTLREPCLAMLSLSWSTKEEKAKDEIAGGEDDIDVTLANLEDQVAKTYVNPVAVGADDQVSPDSLIAVPIEGNENLHLDQDLSDSSVAATDPTNPFVVTAEEPSLRG